MDGIETVTPEPTQDSTTEPAAVEPSTDPTPEPTPVPGVDVTPTPAPAPYALNSAFKVMDQERQFDEFLHGAITTPEQEKAVRELYERAYGLDHVKHDRQVLRDENRGLKDQVTGFDPVRKDLARVGQHLQNNDLESFFGEYKIPDEAIYQYAMNKLQMQENPQMLAAHNQQRTVQQHNIQLQEQNQNYQEQLHQNGVANRGVEITQLVSSPEVSPVAQDYDVRMGRMGAFQDQVMQQGRLHYSTTGQDLPPQEAVNRVFQQIGVVPSPVQQPVPAPALMPTQLGQPPVAQLPLQHRVAKPVIPVVVGSSNAPIRKAIRSIDDINARYNEIMQKQ